MKSSLYLKYSVRSLLRGGQRTVLALFCIAVGIMAVVGLQLAAESMLAAVTTNVRALNQGDVSLDTANTAWTPSMCVSTSKHNRKSPSLAGCGR